MKRKLLPVIGLALLLAGLAGGCRVVNYASADKIPSIVVTYSILGAVVGELAGDAVVVTVLIPNGMNAHEWQPSARDIETVNNARLVVCNGLGLESGLVRVLETARQNGVPVFAATDAITVRRAGEGGAADPHFWTDPAAMSDVVAGLAAWLEAELHLDMKARAADLESRLAALDGELAEMADALPEPRRQLITGHESLGYFAARYGFRVLGSIVPGLTTEAEASAADVAALQGMIRENAVAAVFSELGTSPAVAEAIGRETGARVIALATHALPADGSYFTYERELMRTIVEGLG